MIKVERVLTQSLNAQEWGNVKRALIEIKKHDVKEQSWVKKAWALLGLNIHLFALKWLPRHKVSAPLIFKKNKETIEALLRIPPDKQTVQIEITRFKDLIEKLFEKPDTKELLEKHVNSLEEEKRKEFVSNWFPQSKKEPSAVEDERRIDQVILNPLGKTVDLDQFQQTNTKPNLETKQEAVVQTKTLAVDDEISFGEEFVDQTFEEVETKNDEETILTSKGEQNNGTIIHAESPSSRRHSVETVSHSNSSIATPALEPMRPPPAAWRQYEIIKDALKSGKLIKYNDETKEFVGCLEDKYDILEKYPYAKRINVQMDCFIRLPDGSKGKELICLGDLQNEIKKFILKNQFSKKDIETLIEATAIDGSYGTVKIEDKQFDEKTVREALSVLANDSAKIEFGAALGRWVAGEVTLGNEKEANQVYDRMMVAYAGRDSKKELELIDFKLSSIPPGLSQFKNLKKLVITGNDFQRALDLSDLNLADNNLEKAPDLSALTHLKTLKLHNNKLAEYPDLSRLVEIEFLNLSSNKFTKFLEIYALTKLKALYLDDNPLDFPAPIEYKRKHLDFSLPLLKGKQDNITIIHTEFPSSRSYSDESLETITKSKPNIAAATLMPSITTPQQAVREVGDANEQSSSKKDPATEVVINNAAVNTKGSLSLQPQLLRKPESVWNKESINKLVTQPVAVSVDELRKQSLEERNRAFYLMRTQPNANPLIFLCVGNSDIAEECSNVVLDEFVKSIGKKYKNQDKSLEQEDYQYILNWIDGLGDNLKTSAAHALFVSCCSKKDPLYVKDLAVSLIKHFSGIASSKEKNSKGNSLFELVWTFGECDIIKLVLENGCDPKETDDEGTTVLQKAFKKNAPMFNYELVKGLRDEEGVDIGKTLGIEVGKVREIKFLPPEA